METAVLGGGCFWCLDAVYRQVKGVERVVSGYAGGNVPSPSYEAVSGGRTGHAEVVELTFDPAVISYEQILEIFWHIHDPTTPNRQGNDEGPQYRSMILFTSTEQRLTAERSIREVAQHLWDEPIVTEVKELEEFFPAEDYHQDYFNQNPSQGYCQVVINPKLAKFRQSFAHLLK